MYECRICFDKVNEQYWNKKCEEHIFCNCKGDLARFHLKCLTDWIKVRNKDRCEICKRNFELPIDGNYYFLLKIIKEYRDWLNEGYIGKLTLKGIDLLVDFIFLIYYYIIELPVYLSFVVVNLFALFINSVLFLIVLLVISILINLQIIGIILFIGHLIYGFVEKIMLG